ncbi:hypothetical protein EUGRSUZ_J00885 [Eucalyptus grandis]|uniref:Uncharacterized protein n=2 Tax=Eucalyptus grandis TaxID=71139 RepID=A0A059AC66_EUCGR|nr:hypothetical protein EUGRSUZ_J00885 [Eucalyptus grandis]
MMMICGQWTKNTPNSFKKKTTVTKISVGLTMVMTAFFLTTEDATKSFEESTHFFLSFEQHSEKGPMKVEQRRI